MNRVLDVIHSRRSTRLYKDIKVEMEDIKKVVEAGNMAPTGSGQSWRFVVVTKEDALKRLRELSAPIYRSFLENMPQEFKDVRKKIDAAVDDPVFYSAPAVIYVIGKGRTRDIDCSMVCQNIMLAAESLDLNSCYVYFGQLALNTPEIKELIKIGEDEAVYGPVLIGHGAKSDPYIPNKKTTQIDWI